ncbi:MAG: hypothetical protein WA851_27660, partial [Xanthobacteraceae bacterium]
MNTFVARENIRRFRDRLWSETDGSKRARLRDLLLAEEDKLGAFGHLVVCSYGRLVLALTAEQIDGVFTYVFGLPPPSAAEVNALTSISDVPTAIVDLAS